jgi:hypothetical protein
MVVIVASLGPPQPQNFSGWNIAHPRYTTRNTATMPDTM